MALAIVDNPNPTSIRDAFGDEMPKPAQKPEGDSGAEKFRKMVREFLDTSSAQNARKQAQLCRDYYDGKQWTPEQQAKLKQRGQPPIVFNRIKRKVDSVLGVERRQRTDPKAFGRTPEREESAEIATQALRFVADQTRLNNSFSACFESGMVEGVGAAEIIVKQNDDGDYDIEINPIPWECYVFDVRSRRHDFSDARYHGTLQWMDTEDAADLIMTYLGPEGEEKAEELRRDLKGERAFVQDDTTQDKPRDAGWIDRRNGRVQVCQMYYKEAGAWKFGVVAGQTLVLDQPSYYKDTKGRPICPIEGFAAYIDRDLSRYGIVADMLGPQDEINHRRSKAVHFLHSRRVVARTGAVSDILKAKNEIARPDGWVELDDPSDFQIVSTAEETTGNLNMLQEAKNEIDQLGPNNALQGKGTESQSGRAILAQQQAGMAELAPLYDRFNDFKLRAYRAIWARVKQTWTAPKWIRITDNPEAPDYVGLNQPSVDQMGQLVPHPKTGQPPQMGPDGQPKPHNMVADIDVDIIIDVAPDTVNLQGEEFEQIGEVLSKGAGLPPALLAGYIEASSLPTNRKKKMIDALTGEGKDIPPEQQAQMAKEKQIAEQGIMLELDSKAAATEKMRAETQKLMAPEAPKQPDLFEVQKVQGEHALKASEIDIKGKELLLKEREIALKEAELSLKAQELQARLQSEAEQKQQEYMASNATIEQGHQTVAQNETLVSMLQQVMGELVQMPKQQAEMFTQVLGDVSRMMNAEKEVVRDPATGRALGVRVKANSGAN